MRGGQTAKRRETHRGVLIVTAGDSSFDAAPAGPVVVLGMVFGVPLAPPGAVIAELGRGAPCGRPAIPLDPDS